ncbi:hypothetical protein GCK32_008259 [Trichostrongylus colubriformis]|uniref:Uncharacterized protein n=1 Tax=Trichostrongylus colubriformis TaxID=6319 RepID=A0AAN8J304_TRICO
MDVDNTQIPGNNTESQVNDLSARMASSFGEQRQPATSAQESPSRVPTNERWDSNAPEVNLQRTVESILSAIFQRVDSR